jgi:hypothetical protein
MGLVADFLGDAHVVFIVGRRFPVVAERAVHHHGREAILDRADARGRAVAVVLMHDDWDFRVELGGGDHQMAQVIVLAVRPRAARRLHDDG